MNRPIETQGRAQAIKGGLRTRWRCGTCGQSQPPEATRMREPGWEPGDFDCVACWMKAHPGQEVR